MSALLGVLFRYRFNIDKNRGQSAGGYFDHVSDGQSIGGVHGSLCGWQKAVFFGITLRAADSDRYRVEGEARNFRDRKVPLGLPVRMRFGKISEGYDSRRLPIVRPGVSQLAGPAEKKLRALNGLLTQDATIFLAGCNVGEGTYGDGLLTTVSTILNDRAVQGFESKVFWWTGLLVGSLKEADGTTVSSSLSCLSL